MYVEECVCVCVAVVLCKVGEVCLQVSPLLINLITPVAILKPTTYGIKKPERNHQCWVVKVSVDIGWL